MRVSLGISNPDIRDRFRGIIMNNGVHKMKFGLNWHFIIGEYTIEAEDGSSMSVIIAFF